ncbi:MAG TPA: hypothetical protein PK244_06500 [Pseudomonadales bacterium]|nr:hypothetical protein [Pseudomonadales bacterium]
MGRYLEALKQLELEEINENGDTTTLKNLNNPPTASILGFLGTALGVLPEKIEPIANSWELLPRVRCCDCQHFIPDAIGSGLGIGDCLVGQAEYQPTPLWARSERRCSEWASSDLTGSYQA